jgi:UDP-N-acetylglucosamine 1-carboxyvinyltransferase
MSYFRIQGGNALAGEIVVTGAKNAALKLCIAALLTDEPVSFSRIPEIEDIARLFAVLKDLGVTVNKEAPGQYTIHAKQFRTTVLSREHAPKIRVSTLLIGPLLVREGSVTLPHPGGCALGKRPIDLFLAGFSAFGAVISEQDDEIAFSAKKLQATRFVFPVISHTGTEALMMIASRVPGTTVLVNAAMEPEVVQLADMLRAMGAKIRGDGSPMITIEGVERLSGTRVTVIPDRLEVGSFAALAAATKSDVTITRCDPTTLEVPLQFLRQMGVPLEIGNDSVRVRPAKALQAINITTHEYPGFPTDLQAPFTVLLTQAHGDSLVHETIFDGRLFFTDKLNTMGARITLLDPHRVIVHGTTPLRGKRLESPDIRAGLALVVAALAAEGESIIENIYQIDRGYERIEERLKMLGAKMERVEE